MGPFNFVQGDSSPSTRLRNIIKNITIRRQTFGLALGQGDRMTTPLVIPNERQRLLARFIISGLPRLLFINSAQSRISLASP